MIKNVRRLIPPLLPQFHKGQLGRILVVGGSEDYTGAPYFAAMAAALVGCDMSHILCTGGAAPVIKTYSPNLMVHPYLDEGATQLSPKVEPLLNRVHVVLIGPGLGRDPRVFEQVKQIMRLTKDRRLPLVIDADGLFLVQQDLDVVKSYLPRHVVLTPNVVEFSRLVRAANLPDNLGTAQKAQELAKLLQCAVLVKGSEDVITDGQDVEINTTEGSLRRVSGQGDTLSGALVTFMAWTEVYKERLWDTEPIDKNLHIVAAWGASSVARTASKLAFAACGRAMGTTDVNNRVGEAFAKLYE